jgi:YidC/Oxa1 family membrane protein insertase
MGAQTDSDSTNALATADVALQIKLPAGASVSVPFQLYYGPSDYNILKETGARNGQDREPGKGYVFFCSPDQQIHHHECV